MVEGSFAQIGAILLIALAAGALAKLFRQPVIVAYIAVGVVSGPAVLGVITPDESIQLLAKLGIAILLFLVGLKLDVHLIRSTGLVALLTGVGQVVFTSLIGYLIVLAFDFGWLEALYIAVALTFSSTIIIVKLLGDKKELDQLHGRIAVGFLIVQDILVVVAMVIIVAIGQPESNDPGAQLLSTLLGSVLFLVSVAVLSRFVLPRVLRWISGSQELTLLFGVAWAIALAAVSAAIGLSMEIGAFVAGVALASTPFRESLAARMVSLRDIMILFFFIDLGGMFSFEQAAGQIWPAVVLSLFVLIGNPFIVMVIMGVMGYRSQVSFRAGLVVAQISEFSLILIALGYSLGQVQQEVLSLVTLVGIITITVSTYFILYSDQLYQWLRPVLGVFERKSATQLDEEALEHPYDALVVGAGRLGSGVIEGLVSRGANLLVVDMDPQVLSRLEKQGVDTLYGDVGEPEFAANLPLHEVESVVCTVPDRATNLVLLETLRREDFSGKICLTALDQRTADLLSQDPEISLIRPYQMAAKKVVSGLDIPVRIEKPRSTE